MYFFINYLCATVSCNQPTFKYIYVTPQLADIKLIFVKCYSMTASFFIMIFAVYISSIAAMPLIL